MSVIILQQEHYANKGKQINYKFIKLQPFIRYVDVSFWWRQQLLPKRQQI